MRAFSSGEAKVVLEEMAYSRSLGRVSIEGCGLEIQVRDIHFLVGRRPENFCGGFFPTYGLVEEVFPFLTQKAHVDQHADELRISLIP